MRELNLEFDRGAHVGHLYKSSNELKAVALPFIKHGLQQGEYCLYVTSQRSVDDWYLELQAFGIDVSDELRRGALNVITGSDWQTPVAFNSITRARDVLDLVESKLGPFSAVRLAGDAGWEMEPGLLPEDLCHWEATANLVYEDLDVRTICQYDLRAYSSAAISSALRTHPHLLYRGRNCSNPFYEAHHILENEPHLNSCSNDPDLVTAMLERIALAN